jgi:hypothetical protein
VTGLIGPLALLAAAAFAGAALYVSTVEHPARMRLDDEAALAQWKPSYARGKVMQAGLALIGSLLAFWAWWESRDWLWLAGGIALLASWPFTLLVILKVNHRLEAVPPGGAGPESRALLVRWARLHAVRTLLGAVAALLMLVALAPQGALAADPTQAMDDCCLSNGAAATAGIPRAGLWEVTTTVVSIPELPGDRAAAAELGSLVGRRTVGRYCFDGRPPVVGGATVDGRCVHTQVADRGGIVSRAARCRGTRPDQTGWTVTTGSQSSDHYDLRIRVSQSDRSGRTTPPIEMREEGRRIGPCSDDPPAPANSSI